MRPLTHDATRTLPLSAALDLAVSTLPELREGEAVELDVRHAPVEAPVRTVRAPFDPVAAERLLAELVLSVEDEAPTVTHATVRRYSEAEQTTEAEAAEEL
jgi:hypothetical protein